MFCSRSPEVSSSSWSDLNPTFGALVLGVLLSGHPKSDELSKALLSFKDLFLVGFFLTMGLSGAATLQALGVAAILVLAVPFKVGLFFLLLTRFKLRARPSTLSSLSLANYSEFGLIVGAVGVSNGWIATEWLVIFALAMSMTFVLASPLNTASHSIYVRCESFLRRLETRTRLPEDQPIDPGDAEVLVVGMGRTGTSAYDRLRQHYGDVVLGADQDPAVVRRHQEEGRTVIRGDAADPDFWRRLGPRAKVHKVLFAMSDHGATMNAARTLKSSQCVCKVAATAVYDDEIKELQEIGVDTAYNLYAEAGVGFAESVAEEETA